MVDKVPTEELLADLHKVATRTSPPPSRRDYDKHGKFHSTTYRRRFGSWSNALQKAGYQPHPSEVSPDTLLDDIAEIADDGIAPPRRRYDDQGAHHSETVQHHFHSWWAATVRAGCRPFERRPLKPETLHQYYQTASDLPPEDALPSLLFLFTGLPPKIAEHLTPDWLADRRDRHIVKVPPQHTSTGEPWLFRIPETWQSPHTEETLPTHLPKVLDWIFDHYNTVNRCEPGLRNQCHRNARETNFNNRGRYVYEDMGEIPLIRPEDLRITHGINLARQGVKADTISQRLGIEHTNWKADVQECFIWLDVHENDFSHPDYDPP